MSGPEVEAPAAAPVRPFSLEPIFASMRYVLTWAEVQDLRIFSMVHERWITIAVAADPVTLGKPWAWEARILNRDELDEDHDEVELRTTLRLTRSIKVNVTMTIGRYVRDRAELVRGKWWAEKPDALPEWWRTSAGPGATSARALGRGGA